MKNKTTPILRKITTSLAAMLAVAAAPSAFAASQTWSNAPTDANWTTAANWVGNAVPGALNQTGNSVNNDVVTFNAPIPGSNIGTAGNPILVDDATTVGARGRTIGGITFNTADCGTYIISSLSPAALPTVSTPETGILNVCHNGSIQLTAAVTNSQVITIPLYVRLPSSTAGIYNLVNNSTNPATLYIAGITNDSANTRGTDFRLGGSNTGTNTVGNLSAGTTTSGGNGFTKQGAGTWILAGPNDFRSQTVVRITDGRLIVKDVAAFNAVTTGGITVTNTGILQMDGVTLNNAVLNLHKGGTLLMNGTADINGVAVATAAGTTGTVATMAATDVVSVGTGLAAASIVSGGAADTVLTTAGPGTLIFGQNGFYNNTYAGRWVFGAATNQLNSAAAMGTGANANVEAGAILDLTLLGATAFAPTTAGFGGSGTGTAVGSSAATVISDVSGSLDLTGKAINLNFNPLSLSGDLTRPALYIAQGGLTLSGNTFFINNTSGSPLGVGTYRLISSAATITSGGGYAALISGSGVVAGGAAAIQVSGGNVDLVITIYVPKDLVWSGTGANWDLASSANWLDGVTPSVFNNSDNVIFNSTGSANPTVNLVGTLAPASVVVDTSANDYTFGGSGQVAGTTSLKKVSAGVLTLQTVNTYAGGTVVSNGTLRVGAENAISSTGSGNVEVYGTGTIDLNNLNNAVNGLSGNGSVDVAAGGASTLTVGNNDASGSFSGLLKNTSGTLALAKVGTGTQTLSGANTLAGGVTVAGGTLVAANPSALGTNIATVNSGTLEVPNDLFVGGLSGSGGTIANNTTAATNTIVVNGGNDTTYSGGIVNGSGGGALAVKVLSGSLTLGGNNTYTGGTFVGSGASFNIPNSPAAVGGFIIASNNSILGLTGGSGTPGTPNSVTTVDGAKVLFVSGAEGKIWNAQFNGGPTATNRFIGPVSAGQSLSFSNFLGVVEFANTNTANQNFRFFNGTGISGGENTLFVFESVNVHTRDSQTVRLGAIVGGNTAAGIGDQAGIVSWEIGAKNLTTDFHGYINGLNNSIVKVGTGGLTLDGRRYFTNQVTLPDTSVVDYALFTNAIAYFGSTTVSNGTLKIVAPNNLTVSSNINLAGGVLDATQIGFSTNQTTLDINAVEQPTNSVAVVSGIVDVLANYTINGFGSILGNVSLDAAAVNNVGDYLAVGGTLTKSIGTLAVSGSYAINGTVNMDLNRTNSPNNSDRITAASFSGSGATLNVTDVGPALYTGTILQLFSGPVTAFTTVNLPAANGATTYVWNNKIAVDGTIELVSGASPVDPNPTNITSAVVGNTLQLSWPSSHTGWTLQAQTNSLSVGVSGTWFDVAGSTTTNQVYMEINPANPTVFYRLTLPQP
jgi:fibronectin-binding autotransporter adhesin